MDENFYHKILTAISVNHSSNASIKDRENAYTFCEELKNSIESRVYAIYIFSTPNSELHTDEARHFALHLLENYIKKYWNKMNEIDQIELRTKIMEFIAKHIKHMLIEKIYIKEKLVKLITDIAKRQFIEKWSTFLEDLSQIWFIGETQMEIVLMILRSLTEDCVSSNFNIGIPAARRKEILQGLNVNFFPNVFPIIYNQLEEQYRKTIDPNIVHQNNDKSIQILNISRLLINATLKMICEFIEWMPIESIANPSTNLVNVFVLLLSDKNHQIIAAKCISVMFTRHFSNENISLLLIVSNLVFDKMLEILKIINSFEKELINMENLHYHHHLNSILITWCNSQFENICQNSITSDIHILISKFIQLFLQFFSHPSLLLIESQITGWIIVLKNDKINKQEYIKNSYETLINLTLTKYFKIGSPDREDGLISACSLEEFNDHINFITFYGNLRSKLGILIDLHFSLSLNMSIKMISDQLDIILSNFINQRDHLNPLKNNSLTDLSTAYIYFEGETGLIDLLLRMLSIDTLKNNKEIQTYISSMLQKILEFRTMDPLLYYRQLNTLGFFSKYYEFEPSVLPLVLEKLFSSIGFVQENESINALLYISSETINVRRRAISSLVSISNAIPKLMLQCFPVLCERVISFFRSDSILNSEGVMLYEMLVLVSNSMENIEQQNHFLSQILDEPTSQWTSDEITDLVSSPESFLRQLEISIQDIEQNKIVLPTGTNAKYSLGPIFSKLIKILSTLHGISKRIKVDNSDGIISFWSIILPNLLIFIRTLHHLWHPKYREIILSHPKLRWIISITQEDLNNYFLLNDDDIKKIQWPPESAWSKSQKNMREIAYHMIANVLNHPLFIYNLPNSKNIFTDTILSDIEHMEHRHLKILLSHIIIPFIKKCPKEHYSDILSPTLTKLFSHLSFRLNTLWLSTPKVISNTDTHPIKFNWNPYLFEIEDTKKDIIYEKNLILLSRQSIDLMEVLLDPKTKAVMNGKNNNHYSIKNIQNNDMTMLSPTSSYSLSPTTSIDRTRPFTPRHILTEHDRILREFILFYDSTNDHSLIQSILLLLTGGLCWPNTPCCSRFIHLSDTLVHFIFSPPQQQILKSSNHSFLNYTTIFGQHIFEAALSSLLHILCNLDDDIIKWDMINLIRNIYCRLTLGIIPIDESKKTDLNNNIIDKNETNLFLLPKKILLSLHCITQENINLLDTNLKKTQSIKSQKNYLKEFFEETLEYYKKLNNNDTTNNLDKEKKDKLKTNHTISDKILIVSKKKKLNNISFNDGNENLDAESLFGIY